MAEKKPPVDAVVAAMEAGFTTRAELVEHTGLSTATVDAVLFHLERIGRLRSHTDHMCGGGCGTCPTSGSCSHPGVPVAANAPRGVTTLSLVAR